MNILHIIVNKQNKKFSTWTSFYIPFRGALQLTRRRTPSLNTSKIPGFSLAISLWTVSTRLAEKNGVIMASVVLQQKHIRGEHRADCTLRHFQEKFFMNICLTLLLPSQVLHALQKLTAESVPTVRHKAVLKKFHTSLNMEKTWQCRVMHDIQ